MRENDEFSSMTKHRAAMDALERSSNAAYRNTRLQRAWKRVQEILGIAHIEEVPEIPEVTELTPQAYIEVLSADELADVIDLNSRRDIAG